LPRRLIAVYSRIMVQRDQDRPSQRPTPGDLFAFRPWMLAAAVILACALGIAIMEELGSPRELWAQVTPADAARR
jgi:hypothetical protein